MTTYYEKRGSKYYPVSESYTAEHNCWTKGAHLVVCSPGSQVIRFDITPEHAPMIAAGVVAKDAIADAIYKASEFKPSKVPLTPEQVKAWNKMKKVMGTEMFQLHGTSNCDVVTAGVEAMRVEAEKLLTNPAVKKAYDNFLLIAKLSMENEK